MVVIAISNKETKFCDETYMEIWYKIVDIMQEKGVPIWFLKDSKTIDESLEMIVNKLYFFIENVKIDKELIQQFKDGKNLERMILDEEDEVNGNDRRQDSA